LGILVDGYTSEKDVLNVINFYVSKSSGSDLRNAVSFLLSHYCLLRGESARKAEFADLQMAMLEREGQSECPAFVLVMKQGKTNQFGRVEVSGCIRNTNV
jgi:hypothetical protein